jgi:hypothetical protein
MKRRGDMTRQNKLMNLKAGIVCVLAIFVLTAGASTAHAKVFHAWVEGLPSGLLVQFNGQWSCFLDSHQTFLTETQVSRYEIVFINGIRTLQLVTRTVYVGQVDKLNFNTTCGTEAGITLDRTDFDALYLVWGRDNGGTAFKLAQQHYEVSPDPTVEENVSITIEAKSTALVLSGTSTVPSSVLRSFTTGGFNTWKATYSDSFGFQDILNPSLDFQQTEVTPLGQWVNVSKIKMSLTPDKGVCLQAFGETACKSRALGGTLTVNGVTVSVADVTVEGTQTPNGNGNEMTVTWKFRFSSLGTIKDPGVPAGTYAAIVSADDHDLSDGYFTGAGFGSTPQPKNLLTWKALGASIAVQ